MEDARWPRASTTASLLCRGRLGEAMFADPNVKIPEQIELILGVTFGLDMPNQASPGL